MLRGSHVGPGVLRGAKLPSRDGLEGRPGAAPSVSAAAAALRGQPVLGVGLDARLGTWSAHVVEVADSEGHHQVVACVAARDDGWSPRSPPHMRRHVGVHAGKRGVSLASLRPVVRLSDILRRAGL